MARQPGVKQPGPGSVETPRHVESSIHHHTWQDHGMRGRRSRSPLVIACLLIVPAASGRSQVVDTATALGALRDAQAACVADGGELWGRTLCGPIALADRGTR